jgi:hypothetical protein
MRKARISAMVGAAMPAGATAISHGCKSAPNQDPARDWSYHIDSSPIISVLAGSLSAPIAGRNVISPYSIANYLNHVMWALAFDRQRIAAAALCA